jgi:hypothetical protein
LISFRTDGHEVWYVAEMDPGISDDFVLDQATKWRSLLTADKGFGGVVFRQALLDNAPSIIIAHNHPSGEPLPSPDGVAVTRSIVQAGKLLDIEVLDHI